MSGIEKQIAIGNGKREMIMDRREKNIGKFLSLILRHHPEVIGIELDEHGWADVDALICGIQRKREFSREQLDYIVRTDAKQRYSYNQDRSKIRANQGHSVSVDLEFKAISPPEYLWHGTAQRFQQSIMREGLISGTRLYVHLSSSPEEAKKVGARHGKPVVFQVMSGKMNRDGYIFFKSDNNVWLTKHVPAEYLLSST